MQIKKILKIITVNILLIFIIFAFAELFLSTKEYMRVEKENTLRRISQGIPPSDNFDFQRYYNEMKHKYLNLGTLNIGLDDFRTPIIKPLSDKLPVIILGCSFAYGDKLNNDENFSGQLAKHTNRTIYNLGLGGHSHKSALYIMREYFPFINKHILKDNNQAEYVIYVYINDHLRRQYLNITHQVTIEYEPVEINNRIHLKREKINKLLVCKDLSLYRALQEIWLEYQINNNFEQIFNLFCLYMTEINNEIKTKFHAKDKPTKFIILVYNEYGNEDWNRLRNQGIKVIELNKILEVDINESKYKLLDGHPNAEAWKVITPKVIEYLNL